MTGRDRLVLAVVVAGAVLVLGWMQVVSPERKKLSQASARIQTAQQSLQAAEAELSSARQAQSKYSEAYAAMVRLGKAVPTEADVPALVYEIDQASSHQHVEFSAISAQAGPSASSTAAAPAAAQQASFKAMPFTFTFTGTFAALYHLLNKLQGLAVYSPLHGVSASGRLLTIQTLSLTPEAQSANPANEESPTPGAHGRSHGKRVVPGEHLTGSITATAYVLPAGQSAPAGLAPAGGASAGSRPAAAAATAAGTTPATIKAAP